MEIKRFSGAVPEDSAEIRREVFVDEQGFTDEFDEFDEISTHIVIYDNNTPIATLRFYSEGGGSYHIGRVAVRRSRRKEGLGRVLIDEAIKAVRELGGTALTVGAQENKAGFYARCGFLPEGERYFEQNYPHVKMRLKI